MCMRWLRRLLRRPMTVADISGRLAIGEAARRHLTALSKAKRVLPGDAEIERQYKRMAELVTQTADRE